MAEKLCELKKKGGGGGKYTETVLWTNPSPSSNFSAQTVTLSDSIDNYKYIKIKHKDSTTGSDILEVICSVADLKESIFNKGSVHAQLAIDMQNSGNTLRSRAVGYVSSTSIQFSACYNCNATGSDNSCAIPLEILGLNELDHGTRLSPTFELTSTGLSQSSAYGTNVASNDDTLMTNGQKQSTSTGSITVKRNAKGKIFFNYNSRGSVVTAGSVTFGGNTYSPSSLSGSSVDVEFSANDTINYTCPTGTYFASMCITFMETR